MDVTALTSKINLQAFPGYTDAVILTKLNEALYDLSARYAWAWLFTTETIELVDGTTNYDLPADVTQIVSLTYDGEGARQLDRIDSTQVKELYGDVVGDSDLPTHYVVEGLELRFVPTPDAAQTVNLKCYVLPTELELGTDEPPFHSSFHSMLVDYVIAEFWEQEEDLERAGYFWSRYFNSVERMAQMYTAQLPSAPFILGGGTRQPYKPPFTTWPEV